MNTSRLVTIPISHYCERARWTLEHLQIPFQETPALQMFHRVPLRIIGAKRSVPALKAPDAVLCTSDEIMQWAHHNRRADVEPLVHWSEQDPEHRCMLEWGQRVGVWARVLAYSWILPHRNLMLMHNNQGAPRWQGFFLSLGYAQAAKIVRKRFKINEASVQTAHQELARVLDWIAARLERADYLSVEDGRYDGHQFSALDLTMASYLGILVWPPEYGIQNHALPDAGTVPPDIAQELKRYRSHPAGQYVLRIFAQHRRPAAVGAPTTR